jgi:rubrerythrin
MNNRDLHSLEGCLKAEKLAIEKCKLFSSLTKDPEVSAICLNIANKHQQHYNTLVKHLQSSTQGTVN